MKIYPKKLQSGGFLPEVNYYPTVQYSPTSSVAITQGAWAPTALSMTEDAKVDTDMFKNLKGLTNEQARDTALIMQKINSYNSLPEIGRRSAEGRSLLSDSKTGASLYSNKLENNLNSWKDTGSQIKDKKLVNDLAISDNGNVWVEEGGGVDLYGNKVQGKVVEMDPLTASIRGLEKLTRSKLYQKRNDDDELIDRNELFSELINAKNKEDIDKDLKAVMDDAGSTGIKWLQQSDYMTGNEGIAKSWTTGGFKKTDKSQLDLLSKLTVDNLPDNSRRGLESDAMKFFDRYSEGKVTLHHNAGSASPKGIAPTESYLVADAGVTREKIKNYHLQAEKATTPQDKYKYEVAAKQEYQKFINSYVKSYIMSVFEGKKSFDYGRDKTFKTLSNTDLGNSGLENVNMTPFTPDGSYTKGYFQDQTLMARAKDNSGLFVINLDTPGQIFQKDESKPQVSNIAKEKDANYFVSDVKSDAKLKGYTISSTLSFNNTNMDSMSDQTLSKTFRMGGGTLTHRFYGKKDGKIVALQSGSHMLNGAGKPTKDTPVTVYTDVIAQLNKENKTRIAKDKTKGYTDDQASEFVEKKLRDRSLYIAPSFVEKGVSFVDMTSSDSRDKRLLVGRNSASVKLTDEEKLAIKSQVNKLNGGGLTDSNNIDWDDLTVTIDNKKHKIVVGEIAGIMDDPAKVNAIATSNALGFKEDVLVYGEGHPKAESARERRQKLSLPSFITGEVHEAKKEEGGVIPQHESGGIIPQFTPQKIEIKALSLNDLY